MLVAGLPIVAICLLNQRLLDRSIFRHAAVAAQMKRQSQTIFYLEQMQPDWLSGKRRLQVYDWLAVRLPGMLMGILVILPISVLLLDHSDLLSLIPPILLGGLLGRLLSEGS